MIHTGLEPITSNDAIGADEAEAASKQTHTAGSVMAVVENNLRANITNDVLSVVGFSEAQHVAGVLCLTLAALLLSSLHGEVTEVCQHR